MPTPNGAVILVRMPYALKEALDTFAHAHSIATSEAIRQACAELVGYEYRQQHGNTKYATQQERRAARRRQPAHRAAADTARAQE